MIHIVAVALSLVTFGASPAIAQHSILTPRADSIATALIGTWQGEYQTDHGSGPFTLVISKDSVWKATMDMSSANGPIPTNVSNFTVVGSNVSWTQDLMGMSCKGAAVLAAGTLRGETTCERGSMGYVLRKK